MNKQKGITLIALVVTIILLLILAGITITSLMGENGLLKKLFDAVDNTKIAEYKEKIELARTEVYMENNGMITLDKLIEKIYEDDVVPLGSITKTSEEKARMITPEEYIFDLTVDNTVFAKKGIQRATDIRLNKEDLTISKGATQMLIATIIPEDTEKRELKWTSNNEEVVTVEGGRVKAKEVGEAIITVETIDGSNLSVSCNVKVVDTNYKVQVGENSTYVDTLSEAYDSAISENEDNQERTITVLKDVEDMVSIERDDQSSSRSIIVNKSITIDTNGVKLTINAPINLDNGTLHIKGNGEIYCNKDSSAIICYGGILETSESPKITSTGVGVKAFGDAKVSLNGGYIIGEERSGFQTSGSGEVVINDTYVIGIPRTKNGITINKDATCNIIIKGNSVIANGLKDVIGLGASESTGRGACISCQGTIANLKIQDNAIVTSGPYSAEGMSLYDGSKVEITGNASVYSCMNSVSHSAFMCNGPAEKLLINTTGVIGSNHNNLINVNSSKIGILKNIEVIKGKFVTKSQQSNIFNNVSNITAPSPMLMENRDVVYRYVNSETYSLEDITMPNYYYVEY